MKYKLKTLFKVILGLSIGLALFLRPIRGIITFLSTNSFQNEINGFIYSFYPYFWLCYNEDFIGRFKPVEADGFGIIIGIMLQALAAEEIVSILHYVLFKEIHFGILVPLISSQWSKTRS